MDHGGIDDNLLARFVRGVEREFFEQKLHDGMEAARADVLGFVIDLAADLRHGVDGFIGEFELDVFGPE